MNKTIKYLNLLAFILIPFILLNCSNGSDLEDTNVTFGMLWANPNKYFGENVVLKGYLKKDFGINENPRIGYSLYEELSDSLDVKIIGLIFESDQVGQKAENLKGKHVEISGVFTGLNGDMTISYAAVQQK